MPLLLRRAAGVVGAMAADASFSAAVLADIGGGYSRP